MVHESTPGRLGYADATDPVFKVSLKIRVHQVFHGYPEINFFVKIPTSDIKLLM